MKRIRGFTLAEIVIVVSIISIISGIVLANVATASKKSRDADRKGDLVTLQAAVELYKQKYGRYPAGCRGPGVWSGQVGTVFACPLGDNQYILAHTTGGSFAPEFIRSLPTDKNLPDTNSGYVYTTNAEGTVYKIMSKRTVESEVVDYEHQFKSCDATNSSTGMCDATIANSNSKPNHCQEAFVNFRNTYAVWGGFANGAAGYLSGSVEHNTELIICDIP